MSPTEKQFRESLSKVPITEGLLTELLFEPGARLSLKFIQPSGSAKDAWGPGEYQLQFHRITEAAFDVDVANLPLKLVGHDVEPASPVRSVQVKQSGKAKPAYRVRIRLEEGSLEVVSQGFTVSPLRQVVAGNWSDESD